MRGRIVYIGNALAGFGFAPTTADTMPQMFRELGWDVVVASTRRSVVLRMLGMLKAITFSARKGGYVLIDTYSTKNFWYAYFCALLCRLLRFKYIPILHGGELPHRMAKSPRMTRSIFKYSFSNVAPSKYLLSALEQRGYRGQLIPNSIAIEGYPFKKRHEIRPKILYVRAFADLYNPQMALYVLKDLLSLYSDAELCMVGPDKDGTLLKCKVLAEELGVDGRVKFTGRLLKREWHKLSDQYDIFINTTNKDNTPVSVIEAMALGLPVVSTNPGGIPHLIEDEEEGILVDCDDSVMMTRRIVELVRDPRKGVAISESARSKVEGFDWEVVSKLWIGLLR